MPTSGSTLLQWLKMGSRRGAQFRPRARSCPSVTSCSLCLGHFWPSDLLAKMVSGVLNQANATKRNAPRTVRNLRKSKLYQWPECDAHARQLRFRPRSQAKQFRRCQLCGTLLIYLHLYR